MPTIFPNRAGETGCTYNTTGPAVELSTSALTGLRTFADAATDGDLANGDELFVLVKKDDSNWALWRCTYDTAATPDELDREELLESEGTISNSDSVDVWTTVPAVWFNFIEKVRKRHIEGILPSWTDSNTVAWSAGEAMVDGKLLVYAGGNSGNIGQSADGLSSTGVWCHWLYDNAGTPAIEMKQEASGTPTWDTDLLYWRKGSDRSRRLIGWHHCTEDSGGAPTRYVDRFSFTDMGGYVEMTNPVPQLPDSNNADFTTIRVVSSAGNTTDVNWTSISGISNLLPASCSHAYIACKLLAAAANTEAIISIAPSDISGDYGTLTNDQAMGDFSVRSPIASNNDSVFFGRAWIPMISAQTLYWALRFYTGSATVFIEVLGGRMVR